MSNSPHRPERRTNAAREDVPLVLTLGAGRSKSVGEAVVLPPEDPVLALKTLLEDPARNFAESWFVPGRFRGNRRSQEDWLGSSAAVLDLDYKGPDGKKADLPDNVLKAAGKALRSPNLGYPTPHGLRLVYLFREEVGDPDLLSRACRGAMEFAAEDLRAAGILVSLPGDPSPADGFLADPCTLNQAQPFFTPNATVDGMPRNVFVKAFRQDPWDPAELASKAPEDPPERPEPGPQAPPVSADEDFDRATGRYREDNHREWPAGSGDCPACGHRGCFGRMPGDPTRWACFSTNHDQDSGGVGVPGNGMWHGDVLDLDAHGAGVSPRQHLINKGCGEPPPDLVIDRPKESGRLRFRTLEELKASPESKAEWIVHGILPKGGLVILAGPKAVGKSTLLAALLAAVEAGEPFAGFKTVRTSAVYLSEEPASSVREKAETFGLKNTVFLTRERFDPSLSFADFMRESAAEARRRGALILVIDTWSRFSRLRNEGENSAGAVQAVIDHALDATAKGLTVAISTHFKKGAGEADGAGEAIRGSSALTAAADIVIEVRRLKNRGNEPFRELSFVSRFGETPTDQVVLEKVGNQYRNAGTSDELASRKLRERVLKALRSAGTQMSKDEVRKAAAGKTKDVDKVLRDLVEEELVDRDGSGRKGDPYLYEMADGDDSSPNSIPVSIPIPREGNGNHYHPIPLPPPIGGEGNGEWEGNGNFSGFPPPTGKQHLLPGRSLLRTDGGDSVPSLREGERSPNPSNHHMDPPTSPSSPEGTSLSPPEGSGSPELAGRPPAPPPGEKGQGVAWNGFYAAPKTENPHDDQP